MMSPLLSPTPTPTGLIKKRSCEVYPTDRDERAARLEGFYCRTERRQEEISNNLFFQSCTLCWGVVAGGERRWRRYPGRLAGGARHVIFHTAVNMQLVFSFHCESFHHCSGSLSFTFCLFLQFSFKTYYLLGFSIVSQLPTQKNVSLKWQLTRIKLKSSSLVVNKCPSITFIQFRSHLKELHV